MKYAVLIFLLALVPGALAQKPSKASQPKRQSTVKPKSTPIPLSEKERFDKASAYELAADRVAALEKFIADFPRSERRPDAFELLATSRILIAEDKLLTGESADAVFIYRRVVEDLPRPVPNELFTESIATIPSALFRRGQRTAALEIAALIEAKVEDNAAQLVGLANFHISVENGAEAMRVTAKAAAKDPNSALVRRTLALAHRINFDLELSADSYAKALELDPNSIAAKRGLAEMKRALGKSDEAVALYRELLAKNDGDLPARTGLILSLFDADKRVDAEAELAKALEQTPGNFVLMAGAAYWYASRGISDKAIDLAQKAIAREPRYVWSHITLARGLMAQGKPVAAEQALIKARAYGNFPSLEYEIASARVGAGFYREAAEDLAKHFTVSSSGVSTNLGGRVPREEKGLAELVAFERRASILAPAAADTPENPAILRSLLELEQKLHAAEPNETEIAAAADAFTKGADKMRVHRQLYAAAALLQKRVALGKVLELTKAATGNTEAALDFGDAGAAVMAGELYEARAAAFRKNEFLAMPDVPKQMLSSILRGRIEEIAGWALFHQKNFADAAVRLRRAVSVMPKDSAWWRSSMWRLGAALAADGKDAEALNAYIDSYKIDKPDLAKYAIVEALYKKVNGTTDGLEAKLGKERVAAAEAVAEVQLSPTPAAEATIAAPIAAADPSTPVIQPAETPVAAVTAEPKPEPSVVVEQVVPTPVQAAETATSEPAKPEPAVSSPVEAEQPKPPPADPKPIEPVVQTEVPNALETKVQQDASPTAAENKPAASKPLFEPIIITIPNSRPTKKPAAEVEKRAAETTEKDEAKPKPDSTDTSTGALRPRLVEGEDVKVDGPVPCSIEVSQETISLINGGGTLGILVHLDGPGDIKELTGVPSSAKDIEVTRQPEIVGFTDRVFFVIKSISSALGVYQVTFAAPCGKKDIVVTVR